MKMEIEWEWYNKTIIRDEHIVYIQQFKYDRIWFFSIFDSSNNEQKRIHTFIWIYTIFMKIRERRWVKKRTWFINELTICERNIYEEGWMNEWNILDRVSLVVAENESSPVLSVVRLGRSIH